MRVLRNIVNIISISFPATRHKTPRNFKTVTRSLASTRPSENCSTQQNEILHCSPTYKTQAHLHPFISLQYKYPSSQTTHRPTELLYLISANTNPKNGHSHERASREICTPNGCVFHSKMTSVKPLPVKGNKSLEFQNNPNLCNAMTDPIQNISDHHPRGRSSAPISDSSDPPHRVVPNRGRRSAFVSSLSRRKSRQVQNQETNEDTTTHISNNKPGSHWTRTLSRRRSLCNRLTRKKSKPKYGSRAKTGPISIKAKQRVLLKHPDLDISLARNGEAAEELVLHGLNSIKAEMIDMNTMIIVMEDNMRMLTHRTVEKFFEWIPLFALYLERYMLVEEDLIFRWVEARGGTLRGKLSPAQRMMIRGRIQKELQDVVETQDQFVRHIPAGQRLSILSKQVEILTNDVTSFFNTVSEILPPILRERCTKSEISKSRGRIVKHIVEHVGYQDFLALYTRWMPAGDLLEWKTSVLLPCDFKFFSYAAWERDMDSAHYQIAAGFGERLDAENRDDEEITRQSKVDFERARQTRLQLIEDGVNAELVEEEDLEDYEGDDELHENYDADTSLARGRRTNES